MPPVFLAVPSVISVIIERLIVREGGYVDDPDDPGGATKYGITFAVLRKWRGVPITKFDVMNLDKREATQIYFQWYWTPLKLNVFENDWWLKEFIFDWGVNAGLRQPVRQLQKLVGADPDGSIGPVTAEKVSLWINKHGIKSHSMIVDLRIKWYIKLAENRHTSIKYLNGWFNRANDFRYEAPPYQNNRVIGI